VVPHITDAIQDWIRRVAHVPVRALRFRAGTGAAGGAAGAGNGSAARRRRAPGGGGGGAPAAGRARPRPAAARAKRPRRRRAAARRARLYPKVDGRDGVPDVCVIELGGTVGDIESMPFVEALRQFQFT
jgi:hypothetical protein